ncbi:hypothetical protein OC844_001350 [Tilletia horrida]|nr:hypothetical protein OC844_001350 [Tilletia horrida]
MGAGASDIIAAALKASIPSSSSASPTMPSLADLPVELIELIALSVPDEETLRALAATCRKIRQILHPRFIDLFQIECSLSEPQLWSNLAERPYVASLVRQLTIDPRLDSRPKGRIPAWISSSTSMPSGLMLSASEMLEEDPEERTARIATSLSMSSLSPTLESERDEEARFVDALRHMSHLSKLIWRHNPPHDPGHVWDTLLTHCPLLTDLEIADRDAGCYRGERKIRDTLPSIHYSKLATHLSTFQLTRLVWYTSAFDADDVIISKLGPLEETLINGCPFLEELRIRQCFPHTVNYAGTLLARAHWPRLRILELAHFHAGDCETVAHFFSRHPLIHTLILEQIDFTSGQFIDLEEIADDALPELEVVCAGIDNVNALLRAGTRKMVRKIYGLQFDTQMRRARRPTTWSSSGEGARLLEGLARTTSLRELEGEFSVVIADKLDLVRLFASCAHLTSLKIRCSFAGLLESYIPAFAFLKQIRTIDLPLQHFDVLPAAASSMVHNSLTLRMGSGTGFISTGSGVGGGNHHHLHHASTRAASAIPTPWSQFGLASAGSPRSPSGGLGGAGGMTFVSGLQRRVRMIADVCPELEAVRFGSGMSGVAKVVRYTGSTEVSGVELADEGEAASAAAAGLSSLRLTQCKASGWVPYGTVEPVGG